MYNKQVCQNPQQMAKNWEIIQVGHRGCKSCESFKSCEKSIFFEIDL